jgi:hypothetical protein
MKGMVSARNASLRTVAEDLQRIFGDRLDALVGYGWRQSGPVPSLALVTSLQLEDLSACAARNTSWNRAGAATPLLQTRADFSRSLDAFPIEYGEIIDSHEVVVGSNPFAGLAIRPEDLRRACEVQTKSHLIHLREDYVQSGARPADVQALVRESAAGFATLVRHLARLDGALVASPRDLARYATDTIGLDPHTVGDLLAFADGDGMPSVDATRLFPSYLSCVERLAEFVDRWHGA